MRQPVLLREARDCVCGSEREAQAHAAGLRTRVHNLFVSNHVVQRARPVLLNLCKGRVRKRRSALMRAGRTQGWFSGALTLLLPCSGGSDITASIWTRGRLEERAWLSAAVPAFVFVVVRGCQRTNTLAYA